MKFTAMEVTGPDGGPAIEVAVWVHHHGACTVRGSATVPIPGHTHVAHHKAADGENVLPVGVDCGPLCAALSAATSMASLPDLKALDATIHNTGQELLEPEQVHDIALVLRVLDLAESSFDDFRPRCLCVYMGQ